MYISHTCTCVNTHTQSHIYIYTHAGIHHPFAMTMFESTLYWSDWYEKAILSTSKRLGRYIHKVNDGSALYRRYLQLERNATEVSCIRETGQTGLVGIVNQS